LFDGRANRREFWLFVLFNFVVGLILSLVDNTLHSYFLSSLYGILVIIPMLALSVRRLHDIGRSGWWNLIILLPFIGLLALVIFWASESQPLDNRYGAKLS